MLKTSLSLDDFKPIKLEDKNLFDNHYSKYPPMHSDNLFTTMISWMDYSNYQYAYLNDDLIIFTNINNIIQFRLPSGKFNKEVVQQVFQLAKKEGSDSPIGLIDNEMKNQILKIWPGLDFIQDRKYYDYVYLASNLADLSGSDYSKIRNRLNKFISKYNYTIEKITEENMAEVGNFLKRWCLWKDCDSDILLENEKKAILYSMSHFFELNLSGIAVLINGKIEAIAVFEKMSPDTAVVHYEKGSPDYDGIYKAINQETAKILQKDFKYINRQSDMDLPGLRKAKMSYRPYRMIEVSHIEKKNL
ncbi:hypothetical protein AYK20_08200 [Thermoplasmatales archaeon SG8-52-1]|nr:MAG: hypothetical protein AYK20_08200 [Thermoplasmatales archaeon SG8-52-1]